ncbi:MAG: YegS/Rv2252/BmrU family lipid kinase [Clostridia bacterium]|nr:YegS/Rv2252/BmrU family lipid kinase [Clostridia bacterium]
MSKKLLLILNPCSGKMAGKRHLADVLEAFCRADYAPTVYVTTGRGNARELAAAYGGEAELVVCLGGDGTFNEVVAGLLMAGHTTPIGYIPCGSTNDFANSIGLKKTIPAATEAILTGKPHTYDVGVFGGRHFTYVASFGMFTRASYATPQNVKNALGHLAYVLEGIKDLSNIRPWRLRFELEDEVLEGEYIFGAISNSTSVGGVLTLDPKTVDMNDGLLELLLIKMPKNAAELSECIKALVEQKYTSPHIVFRSAARMTVTADPAMEWSLDGEWNGGSETVVVENLHDAIRLIQ